MTVWYNLQIPLGSVWYCPTLKDRKGVEMLTLAFSIGDLCFFKLKCPNARLGFQTDQTTEELTAATFVA